MGFSKDDNGQVLVFSNCPWLDIWILCFLLAFKGDLLLAVWARVR
jgi:hypothetical protein